MLGLTEPFYNAVSHVVVLLKLLIKQYHGELFPTKSKLHCWKVTGTEKNSQLLFYSNFQSAC